MPDTHPALGPHANRLVQQFALRQGVSADQVDNLRTAIGTSPTLMRQIEFAASSGVLRRLELLPPDASPAGEYHAAGGLIKLRPDVLAGPGTTAFILGHETQHALNSATTAQASRAFHATIAHAAGRDRDYTPAVEMLIASSRWDESTANLAGWNALVDHVRSTRKHLRLSDIVAAAPHASTNFVVGRGRRSRILPSLSANGDLTISMTDANIKAMGRKHFDKPPAETRLGARRTSDYPNYYAAWAVGRVALAHNKSSPGQPMRLDLARLGLSRKIMEENGIELHGASTLAYVDCSTQPPTHDVFHHTEGTYAYIPPINSPTNDQAHEAARLALIGFPKSAAEAVSASRLRTPGHRQPERAVARSGRRDRSR